MPRTALVTGGASGLGAASAARLRAEGLTVITLDVSGPADVTADVTDEAALRQVAGQIGPVDVLVNSAGIVGANKPLLETTAQEWRRVLEINVLGTVNTMRIFVPGMRERGWGRVVNLASMAGKDGNPQPVHLFGVQGRGHRPDQVGGQGAGHHRCAGQRHRPSRHRHPDERRHRPGRARVHDQPDPDEAGRPS
jgi:NAD(P)-dependent dehydrogenase (short-subunit alcohol dehydrogenase family)